MCVKKSLNCTKKTVHIKVQYSCLCCKQYWTSPGSNTPQDTNCTATCLLSRKLFRHAGHCWRSRDELISDILLWNPHKAKQKQDDQHEHTFSNYVRIRDVVQKTCQRQWTIGKSGERGSGISVLPAQHDDDEDELICH